MPTRSLTARNSTHQTASSVTVLMVPARWVPRQSARGVLYKQVLTDPGIFAIIHGAVSGAIQPFHCRGTKQDEMLRIIAYVRALDK
jgi:hypothetical protein